MACGIYRVKLCEKEGGLFLLDVIADDRYKINCARGDLGNVLVSLNYACGDGIPLAEGSELCVGHYLADSSEKGGEYGVCGIGLSGDDVVVESVHLRANA